MQLLIRARSRHQLVLIVLVYVCKVVGDRLLWATIADCGFITPISCGTWTKLVLCSRHGRSLLFTNSKHWSSLREVDSLAIAPWSRLHFLLPSATKGRALTATNLELWASFVSTIHTVHYVVVSWTWDILLDVLIDKICPRM